MTVLWCSRALVLSCLALLLHVSTGAHEHQNTSSQDAPATGLIAGQVVDAHSGQPLAGVIVSLQGTSRIEVVRNANGQMSVRPNTISSTDSQGRFVVTDVRAGTYTVFAAPTQGFASATASVELAAD